MIMKKGIIVNSGKTIVIYMKEYIVRCFEMMKNKTFINHFILYSLIFISSFIVSLIIGLKNINLSEGVVFLVKNYTTLKYGDGSFVDIFANNFFISIMIMYYFYLLYPNRFKNFFGIFYFFYMGSIGGFTISTVAVKYNMVIALSLVVPHGIIEIPAII